MPVIKSAIKKLRQDKKREKQNESLKNKSNQVLRNAKKKGTGKAVSEAYAMVDKLAKQNIIHKNKASRLKAKLSKIAKPVSAKIETKSVKEKANKNSAKPAKKSLK